MAVEYLGEKVFLEEIKASGQVWVARSVYKNIYSMEIEEGVSLPVWSSSQRAEAYLRNRRPVGPKYEPHSVTLDVFTVSWLSDQMMAITELQINPDGKSYRVLALTAEEFQASQNF